MDVKRKLEVLADAAKHDASCASGGSKRAAPAGGIGNVTGTGICHSYTPDGRCVSLLKILLTNHCIYDCRYCESRISSNVERARFTVEEVVDLTLGFYRRNVIEGLFLSSGILKSPDHTLSELVRVATTLRDEHAFGGYIHLKAPPGASRELLDAAGRAADRLSVNVELPTSADLARLAPEKNEPAIERVMTAIRERLDEAREDPRAPRFAPAGQTTQMIVGATAASDRVVLERTQQLYRVQKLRRVYFASFSPIVHADPWLPEARSPLVREHRLYEADWLVRRYGFRVGELFEASEMLDPAIDPKLAWALRHREAFPLDVHTAPREALLRVPGLGVKNVDRILRARRHTSLRLADLARMRVVVARAAPFLVTADGPSVPLAMLDRVALGERLPSTQLSLFGRGER